MSKSIRLPASLQPAMPMEEFIGRYENCSTIRELLAEHLTKCIERAILESESKMFLDSPNYTAAVSDNLGFRRGLRQALSLLTLPIEADQPND